MVLASISPKKTIQDQKLRRKPRVGRSVKRFCHHYLRPRSPQNQGLRRKVSSPRSSVQHPISNMSRNKFLPSTPFVGEENPNFRSGPTNACCESLSDGTDSQGIRHLCDLRLFPASVLPSTISFECSISVAHNYGVGSRRCSEAGIEGPRVPSTRKDIPWARQETATKDLPAVRDAAQEEKITNAFPPTGHLAFVMGDDPS